MSGVTQNINSVVDNFNGGSVGRDDLAPAIVFSVAVSLLFRASSSLLISVS